MNDIPDQSGRVVVITGATSGLGLVVAVNHLAHFALTLGLLDLITARVVTVTSVLHRKGKLDPQTPYSPNAAYNRSKLANMVFALELHRRLSAAGSEVRSIAAHPGYAATNLQASVPPGLYRFLLTKIGNPLLAVPATKGAIPLLYAATAPEARSGTLIGPGGVGEMRGAAKPLSPSPEATDPAAGRRLWTLSEQLTGAHFTA